MTTSNETRIPTETFLLPGQQFCVGVPWEREALKKKVPTAPLGVAKRAPKKPVGASIFDAVVEPTVDPRAGETIGACEVIRRLVDGSDNALLALRDEEGLGTALVVLRRIALPRSTAKETARQAEWAARLHHPALARTFSSEETDEASWWVTELVAGATFAELAVACRAEGKRVPTGLAVGAVLDAATGLAEVHAQHASHALVCDRSIAVGFDGGARLLDVGLFKVLAQQASWKEVREAMTPYFAPEQLLEGHPPDARTDLFGLAMVLYEALSGEPALRGKSFDEVSRVHRTTGLPPLGRLDVALDRRLAAVVDRAVGPRTARFASVREFATALREASGGCAWRKEVRARFVSDLFADRKRRQDVLLASVAPERARRRASEPSFTLSPSKGAEHRELTEDGAPGGERPGREVRSPSPATATAHPPVLVPPLPVVTFPDKSKKKKRRGPPQPVSRVVLGVAATVGLAVGFVGSQVARLATQPVKVVVAPVVVLPAPEPAPMEPQDSRMETVQVLVGPSAPPASSAEVLASIPEPVLAPVAPTPLAAAPLAVAPKLVGPRPVAPKKLARAAKEEAVPLPPWLAGKKSRR